MTRSGHIDKWAVTRLHNAMTIIEIDDARILTDPWFVDSRAFAGRSPIGVHELPVLTAIIGCHWVKDHWGMAEMQAYPHKDTPIFVSAPNMEQSARKVGFTNVEVLEWGAQRALTDTVTLHALEEHIGRGRQTNNYAIVSSNARIFFGGEACDLEAIRRCGETHAPFDVAIGPVNGVHLMGRQLTATATQMLEATRLLHAPKLVPVHDEHKPFGPLLKVASSIRDFDSIEHSDVEIIELGLGERYEQAS
jgi:L-ascorbate metabolism protein UlaG (beta-lactamase superfamily)